MESNTVTAVIVTYNRKALLMSCLTAVMGQTRKPDRILIVDNASKDGTRELLQSEGWLSRPNVELLALNDNTGGAGGFSAGLLHATKTGTDWAWLMDDDAEPYPDALEKLLDRKLSPCNLYGSVAAAGELLSWPMDPQGGKFKDTLYKTEELPDELDVRFIPFLGILVSSEMVERIGVPDAGFFLAADDVEYCLRARNLGAKVMLIRNSRIAHPASERYKVWLPRRPLYSLKLAPWKRYYDVRNRIFVARAHHGLKLWYSTIPGSFLRLFATLWHESNRWQQIRAFYAGMTDGLHGRKGRRHELWGLK